jgi:hypothetical protein
LLAQELRDGAERHHEYGNTLTEQNDIGACLMFPLFATMKQMPDYFPAPSLRWISAVPLGLRASLGKAQRTSTG